MKQVIIFNNKNGNTVKKKTNPSVFYPKWMKYYKTDEFIQNFSLSFQLISGRNMYMVFITVNNVMTIHWIWWQWAFYVASWIGLDWVPKNEWSASKQTDRRMQCNMLLWKFRLYACTLRSLCFRLLGNVNNFGFGETICFVFFQFSTKYI